MGSHPAHADRARSMAAHVYAGPTTFARQLLVEGNSGDGDPLVPDGT